MSGGSYDYLYSRVEQTISNMSNLADDLESIARDMQDAGHPIPAERVRMFTEKFSGVEYSEKIRDILRSFEWWYSADTTEEDFIESYTKE